MESSASLEDKGGTSPSTTWMELRCVRCYDERSPLLDSLSTICLDASQEVIYGACTSGMLRANHASDLSPYTCVLVKPQQRKAANILQTTPLPVIRTMLPVPTGNGVVLATEMGVHVYSSGCCLRRSMMSTPLMSTTKRSNVRAPGRYGGTNPSASQAGAKPIITSAETCLVDVRCMDMSPFDPAQFLLASGGSLNLLPTSTSARVGLIDIETGKTVVDTSFWSSTGARDPASYINSQIDPVCLRWSSETASISAIGCSNGFVSLRDASTLRQTGSITPFMSGITAMERINYLLLVAGLVPTSGYMYGEIRAYDIRLLGNYSNAQQALVTTVPFVSGATQLKADYSYQFFNEPVVWALSGNGETQILAVEEIVHGQGTLSSLDSIFFDAGNDVVTSLCISDAGLICAGDSAGYIHQWTCAGMPALVHVESLPLPDVAEPGLLLPPNSPYSQLPLHVLDIEMGYSLPLYPAYPLDDSGALLSDIFSDQVLLQVGAASTPKFDRMKPSLNSPFARFPPKPDPVLVQTAYPHNGLLYIPAPRGFVRNSTQGHLIFPEESETKGWSSKPASDSQNASATSKHANPSSENGSVMISSVSSTSATSSTPWTRICRVYADLVKEDSVEGFDFSAFNESHSISGLSNALPNSYVNALLQALFHQKQVQQTLACHQCAQDLCISCELRFLFRMLAAGETDVACEPSNFTRAFMKLPNAVALGVLDDSKNLGLVAEVRRIESVSLFLLEQLKKDEEGSKGEKSSRTAKSGDRSSRSERDKEKDRERARDPVAPGNIERLFGAKVVATERFSLLPDVKSRSLVSFQHTLRYEDPTNNSNPTILASASFATILQHSLHRNFEPVRAFCEKLNEHDMLYQERWIETLPNMLLIACDSGSLGWKCWWTGVPEEKFKQTQTGAASWGHAPSSPLDPEEAAKIAMNGSSKLPLHIRVEINRDDPKRKVRVTEQPSQAESSGTTDGGDIQAEYDLVGVVSIVTEDNHLVTYLNLDSLDNVQDRSPPWWIVNDFTVSKCRSEKEVTCFHMDWKMPSLILFRRRGIKDHFAPQPSELALQSCSNLDSDLAGSASDRPTAMSLHDEVPFVGLDYWKSLFLPTVNRAARISEQDLSDFLGKDKLVALDCEFVMMDREEVDIYGDMTSKLVRPARHALGRVSVVTGTEGPNQGRAFIDDYISFSETPVDYLTRFSGLKEGDLAVGSSPYRLTSLKRVYLKLLALLDAGCIFVGHGLKKDFRIINFIVPKTQVKDTVLLFHKPGRRFLSLRFLTSALLGLSIQTLTHDSIEDAEMALKLYYKHVELCEKNMIHQVIEALYVYGKRHNWKVNLEDPFEY